MNRLRRKIKFSLNPETFKPVYTHRERPPSFEELLKSKGFLVSLACTVALVSNVVNYYFTTSWRIDLPSLEILTYLANIHGKENESVTGRILVGIYLRKQDIYLKNLHTSTIVTTPTLRWSTSEVELAFHEGVFDFASNTIISTNQVVIQSIVQKLGRGSALFGFTNGSRILQFTVTHLGELYHTLQESVVIHKINKVLKFSELSNILNLTGLISDLILSAALLILLYTKNWQHWSFWCSVFGASVCLCSNVIFALVQFSFCIASLVLFSSPKIRNIAIIYCLEGIGNGILIPLFWNQIKRARQLLADRELFASFRPSPAASVLGSSVYNQKDESKSERSVDAKSAKSDKADTLPGLSLDPDLMETKSLARSNSLVVRKIRLVDKYPIRCATAPMDLTTKQEAVKIAPEKDPIRVEVTSTFHELLD